VRNAVDEKVWLRADGTLPSLTVRPEGTGGNEKESEWIDDVICGDVVQLVRTPVTLEVADSSPVAPARMFGVAVWSLSYRGPRNRVSH
jgi:hypothetical protein